MQKILKLVDEFEEFINPANVPPVPTAAQI